MLTTQKNLAKPDDSATRATTKQRDLKFASANQQLEGFSGEVTEAVAAHQPDMKAIAESAKKFGAQVPDPAKQPATPRHPR